MITAALHQAVYDKLTGDATLMGLVTGVYSSVIQSDDSGDATPFPYITFDIASTVPNDTDDSIGTRDVFRVHVWHRGNDDKARRAIVDRVRASMPRDGLTLTGGNNLDCSLQSLTELPDPDGITTHSIVQFRTNVHDIS